MAYKPNTGIFSANKYKREDRHPDSNGNCELICPHCKQKTDWVIAAWQRTNQRGGKFTSLAFQTKEEAEKWKRNRSGIPTDEQAPAPTADAQPQTQNPEDDIPF